MNNEKLRKILKNLLNLCHETEWLEFKKNNYQHNLIGEYISALSNSACLHQKDFGYLIFGIEDKTHNVVGTKFTPKKEKIGNEELENWLAIQLKPRIDFRMYEIKYNNLPIIMFEIDATKNIPVKFNGIAYIRIGSYKKKLLDFPEKERKIWIKNIEIKNNLKRFENFIVDSKWEKEYIDNKEVWVCNDESTFQIEISSKSEVFSEEWTKVFPDKVNSGKCKVSLVINGNKIKETYFVYADGYRIFVPLPKIKYNENNKRYLYWERDSLEYKMAQIIGEFYDYNSLEGVAGRTNIKILD